MRAPRRISVDMSPSRTNTKNATRWVVVLTALGSLMAALDTLVVSTALSTIRLDLGASVEQLEWTVNAYNLSFAVLLMTGAALGDRFGRRNLYAVGPGLCSPPRRPPARWRPSVGVADRRARRAGRRRGAADAARPGAAERRLPARAPRRGDRDLQRDHRPGRGQRPAGRRRRGPGIWRGSGSSGSTSRSALVADPARAHADDGELRRRHRPRHPRPRAGHRRRAGHRLGARARQRGRLGQRRGARRRSSLGARCSSAPSSPGSCAPASRCCRWASSARAPSRPATRRSSSRSRRCSARCSSTRSCCRPGSATARSAPACG